MAAPFFGSGPWRNEHPGQDGMGDSNYSGSSAPQEYALSVTRDAENSAVVLWSYTVPVDTKLTAEALNIIVSPGGTWGLFSGTAAPYDPLGEVSLKVDGAEFFLQRVRRRGLHEVITGGTNIGANSAQDLKSLPDGSLGFGDGIQLTSGQVLTAVFTAAAPLNITGSTGSVLPGVARIAVFAKNTATGAIQILRGHVRIRDTGQVETFLSHTVGAQGLTILRVVVCADGNQPSHVCRWVFLRLNGEIIHEFLDIHATARCASRQGENLGGTLSVPLWGAELVAGDKLELIGNPQTDAGGTISCALAGPLVTTLIIPDAEAPTITNVAPTPGTELATRTTPVTFTVEDVDPGLRTVLITLRYANAPGTFVVHDGDVFRYPFDSSASVREATDDGYNFTVLPRGGWLGDIDELRVLAFDEAGNVGESEP